MVSINEDLCFKIEAEGTKVYLYLKEFPSFWCILGTVIMLTINVQSDGSSDANNNISSFVTANSILQRNSFF